MKRSIAFLLVSLWVVPAIGQEPAKRENTIPVPGNPDHERAGRLFDEGREDMKYPQRLAAGCEKLSESYRLLPRGDTLLNLAECHRRENKTATAWREFGEALEYALAAEFDEAIEAANDYRRKLGENLSRFRIEVPPAVTALPELELKLNGEVIAIDDYAKLTVVDPGTFVVLAKAEGYQDFEATVEVGIEKDEKTVTVEMEPVPPPPAPPPPAPPPPPPAPAPVLDDGTPWWVWTLGGVGLAALGGSVATGFLAVDAGNELDETCGADRNACPADYDSDDVYDRGVLTFGLFVGLGATGLVAVGTAAGFLIEDAVSAPDTAWSVSPMVGPTAGGLLVGRSF